MGWLLQGLLVPVVFVAGSVVHQWVSIALQLHREGRF